MGLQRGAKISLDEKGGSLGLGFGADAKVRQDAYKPINLTQRPDRAH
jgi:hypothetical protein